QIGHVPAEVYAINAQQTARLMKMTDPSVELVVCGSCAPDLPTYLEWDRKVLEHVKSDVDYLSLHRYVGNEDDDTEEYLAVANSIDRQIEATDSVCRSVWHTKKTKKRILLSCDEWNVWYRARHGEHLDGKGKFAPHLLEEHYNLEDALVAAGFLNSFIRHADCVKIANLAQIVNVIAPILTRGDEMFLQTIFYTIEMFSKRRTGTALEVRVDGPGYSTAKYGHVNYLDSSAILNGDKLNVFLVNRSLHEPMEVVVDLADARIKKLVDADFLWGTDPKADNTFEHPHRVQSCTHDEVLVKDGVATVSLPPLCVYAGTFMLER
ncbi:MAG TPA: alpha-L-arabinofuranosidase C-terminal domain-containing protein, partial [Fimbriimonas sp.]